MALTSSSQNTISCPLSNNSLTGGSSWPERPLTPAGKKSAERLHLELEYLATTTGLMRILIITITFSNPLPGHRERERRLNRFVNRVLKKRFEFGVTIFDRSDTGRPHYHIVVVGPDSADYRGSFNFTAWDRSHNSERHWDQSGRTDIAAETEWRNATAIYAVSATSDLRAVWQLFELESTRYGIGRINALPVRDPKGYSFYHAQCVTRVHRMAYPEDHGLRCFRFWGPFPRAVVGKFTRLTKSAIRWRGKLAFCAYLLGFTDFNDFAKYFGHRWFLYLKGIIRLVPAEIATASLETPNLPLSLIQKYRDRIRKIEIELLDRLDRFGRNIFSDDNL